MQSKGLSRVSNTTVQKHLMFIWDTFLCSLFIELLLCAQLSRHWDYSCGSDMAPRGLTPSGGKSQTGGMGLLGSKVVVGGRQCHPDQPGTEHWLGGPLGPGVDVPALSMPCYVT